MVKQPVEKGRGHDAVAHHLGPGLEALVRGDDDGDLLIELADHVEEEVCLPSLDGRIADLVQLCGAPHNWTNGDTCRSTSMARSCSFGSSPTATKGGA